MEAEIRKYLCHECIGDNYLKMEVKKLGVRNKCSFCHRPRKCLSLDEIATRVDEVYREYYKPSEEIPTVSAESDDPVWEYIGDSPEYIISGMMDVENEVAEDIVALLADEFAESVIKDGDEDYYDEMSVYEEIEIHTSEFSEIWSMFCESTKHQTRFFNSFAESLLDDLFYDIENYKSFTGKPAIRTLSEIDDDRFIYRGRQADDKLTKLKISLTPQKELGAPPPGSVSSGRMNPPGISVFYGSFTRETCLAEIRLPVGSNGITGEFEIIRPLRLLDMTMFDENHESISMFDPEYRRKTSHRLFMRDFHKEIRKPILPTSETIEYIPTQVVAEYLANKYTPRLDGIIYLSTQTGGHGLNIVLFSHATKVEGAIDHNSNNDLLEKFELHEDEGTLGIEEKQKTDPVGKEINLHRSIIISLDDSYSADRLDDIQPALRFVQDSLLIGKVTSIEQNIEESYIHYYSREDLNEMKRRVNDLFGQE